MHRRYIQVDTSLFICNCWRSKFITKIYIWRYKYFRHTLFRFPQFYFRCTVGAWHNRAPNCSCTIYIYILYNIYLSIYLSIYIYIYIYMQSWKQCTLPVMIAFKLRSSCFCEIRALCVSQTTYDHLYIYIEIYLHFIHVKYRKTYRQAK